MAGVEPATSRVQGEVTAIYTTAKPPPGISDKGRISLRTCVELSEVTLVCRHGQTQKRKRELHARPSGLERDELLLLCPAKNGAPRSARTFVSSSSGKRLSCLSYRGEIGECDLERAPGVEPGSGVVGNDISHHARPRVLVAAAGLAPAASEFQARMSAADFTP